MSILNIIDKIDDTLFFTSREIPSFTKMNFLTGNDRWATTAFTLFDTLINLDGAGNININSFLVDNAGVISGETNTLTIETGTNDITAQGRVVGMNGFEAMVPVGAIIEWSGTLVNSSNVEIPDYSAITTNDEVYIQINGAVDLKWVLCTGATYGSVTTPDKLGRFTVSIGTNGTHNYEMGATIDQHLEGGQDHVTLIESQLASHAHAWSGTVDALTGDHQHTIYGRWGDHSGNEAGFNNIGSGTTANDPFHVFYTDGYGYNSGSIIGDAPAPLARPGQHTHTVSGAADAAGGGLAHENRPTYIASGYIMRIA